MPSYTEILKQIGELTAELDRAFAEECGSTVAEAQSRIAELSAELEAARVREEEALAGRHELERDLETAEKRIETLVQKLKEARQAAAEAGEEAQKALRRQLEALQEESDDARAELDQERSIRKRLEKGAAADEKRLNELQKALDEKPAAGASSPAVAGGGGEEVVRLNDALNQALADLAAERQAREGFEEELGETHKLIEALEKAVKQSREAPPVAGAGGADADVRRLAEKLRSTETRLEQAQREGQQYVKACTAAEQRVAELEAVLRGLEEDNRPSGPARDGAADAKKPGSDPPLPHELRPAPKPGALFRPDWDLPGLPCKSADQVLQAWGSVFNVQLSLEGYPSQYCAAFLVVLKVGKQKQLFVLFNMKRSKHVLVCVPGKPPGDDAALNKLVGEGQKYLQMSGFELEKVEPADVDRVLGLYFQ